MKLKAILFDVDGTLAETEEAHRLAFNQAFGEAGQSWCWSQEDYRELLRVTGGRERIAAFLRETGEALAPEDIATLHRRKNVIYAQAVADEAVAVRPGVVRLIDEARSAGVLLGIATTTSRTNLEALLDGLFGPDSQGWFDAVVVGEDVAAKKPDPEVYARALAALDLPADRCVAIEDSRNGLEATKACGIATVITPSFYTAHENFAGAALVRASLDGPPPVDLAALESLHMAVAR